MIGVGTPNGFEMGMSSKSIKDCRFESSVAESAEGAGNTDLRAFTHARPQCPPLCNRALHLSG